MKICIDGIGASKLSGTNMFSYTRELLSTVNSSNKFTQVFTVWDSFPLKKYFVRLQNINYIPLNIDRTSSNYDDLLSFLKESSIDIYHSPNNGFSIPKEKYCKYICTIHSLYPVKNREFTDESYYNKFTSIVPNSLENCDKIIAVSEFTKQELMSEYNTDESKIAVINPKCSPIFVDMGTSFALNFLKKHYNISKPFIFYAGSITERKMLDKVIMLLKEINAKNSNIDLVIAGCYNGKREPYYKKIKDLIVENNLEDNVHFLGRVKFSHMPVFYTAAICTIDFSSYNDFPLSIIEAINCSSFVLCNKTPTNTTLLKKAVVYTNFDDFNLASDIIVSAENDINVKAKIISLLSKPVLTTDEDTLAIYDN